MKHRPVNLFFRSRPRASAAAAAQRGSALIESTIAFAVLCLSVLAVGRIAMPGQQLSLDARYRGEAVRLAQSELDQIREMAALASEPSVTTFADALSSQIPPDSTVDRFQVHRTLQAAAGGQLAAVRVQVRWSGVGADQEVVLNSMVARAAPRLSGVLALDRSVP